MPVARKRMATKVGKIARRVALETVLAVLVADALTAAGMTVLMGADFSESVTVGTAWKISLLLANLVTLVVTPVFAVTMAIVLRHLRDARDALAQIALKDPLTGLLNRRGFNEESAEAFVRSRQTGSSIAALMCDIDHFKSINDRFGHEFGDFVLKTVAEIFRESLRGASPILGRQGGEEFVALLPNAGLETALRAAEIFRATCASKVFVHEGQSAQVTISIGVAMETSGRQEIQAILARADSALYKAKSDGRDRVVSEGPRRAQLARVA